MTHAAAVLSALVASVLAAPPVSAQTGYNQWSDPSWMTPGGLIGNGGIVATDDHTVVIISQSSGQSPFLYRGNLTTGAWDKGDAMPVASPVPSAARIAVAPGTGQVYVVAKEGLATSASTFSIWKAAPGTLALTKLTTVNPPVNGTYDTFAATATDSRVYLFLGRPSVSPGPSPSPSGVAVAAAAVSPSPSPGTGGTGGTGGTPTTGSGSGDTRPAMEWNFYEFNPDAPATPAKGLASPEVYPGAGLAMAYPGTGGLIYVASGRTNGEFWAYDILLKTWAISTTLTSSPPGIPVTVASGAMMGAGSGGSVLLLPGGSSTKVLRYSGTAWSTVATLPVSPLAGSGVVQPTAAGSIHVLRGGGFADLWSFAPASGGPTPMTLAPAPVGIGAGGAAAGSADGTSVYVLAGGSTKKFLRYDIAANAWISLPDVSVSGVAAFAAGASLAAPGNGYLYATVGGGSDKSLLRYDLATGAWSARASLPGTLGEGGRMIAVGTGTLYAIRGLVTGRASVDFYRYSIADDSWSSLSPLPVDTLKLQGFGMGAALAFPGAGDFLYALQGDGGKGFWRYSISANAWNRPEKEGQPGVFQDAPEAPGSGSVLTGVSGGRMLYAFRGMTTSDFWSYDFRAGAWSIRAAAPGTISGGSALLYPGSGFKLLALQGATSKYVWSYAAICAPKAPEALVQSSGDAGTVIATGGSTKYQDVTVQAGLADDDGDSVLLQVELKEVGQAFSDTAEGAVATGLTYESKAGFRFENLLRGASYRWRARAIDAHNLKSDWSVYGGVDTLGAAAFSIGINRAPSASQAGQVLASTGAEIAAGGSFFARSELRLTALVEDPDGSRDELRFEVEVQRADLPFTNAATASTGLAASGTRAEITIVPAEGLQNWQYRVIDDLGEASTWTAFAPGAFAFEIVPGGSLGGSSKCGGSASGGTGLVLAAAVAGILLLRRPSLAAAAVLLAGASAAAAQPDSDDVSYAGAGTQARLRPSVGSSWNSRSSVFIGSRPLADEGGLQDHAAVALLNDFQAKGSPVSFAFDLRYSVDNVSEDSGYELKGSSLEVNGGVRRPFGDSAVRPFLGGGLSLSRWNESEVIPGGYSSSMVGLGIGVWVDAGVTATVSKTFSLGLEVALMSPLTDATDLTAEDLHVGISIGGSF